MKLGSFYEVYFNDAVLCHTLLDIRFQGGIKDMKAGRLRCGFFETALNRNVKILVERGYKVAVIECTETRRQKEQRQGITSGQRADLIKRELSEIISRGTL